MPRRRFRFRPAAAVVLLSAAACQSRAAWTYADGGTSRVQRIYQGVLARCAAAWMPAEIVSSNAWYTLVTNDLGTLIQVTQGVAWGAVTTNAWGGPGVLTSDHLQMLDNLLLSVTPRYVDTHFCNAATNYDDWFAREAHVPLEDVYLTTNGNLARCTLDDDWRNVYGLYGEGTGYDDYRGRYRVRPWKGAGELPDGNTIDPPGDWEAVLTPTNYPMLTPAAVGHRLGIGRVDLMETNIWGQITGGQFRWTKDWRDDHGTNTSAWVLWEIAAAKAPYTWSGFSHGYFGTGAGLLIPFWIDPYRDAWLKANSSLGATNLWAASAAYMRSLMDGGGPCYIAYTRHNPGVSHWPGENCAVVGRRVISNAVYWCQAVGYYNPPVVTNSELLAILLVPRGTNAVPPIEEPFYFADLTNRYAPARLLTKTGSETNAFWAAVHWSGEFVNNEIYYPGDNIIAPATNEWYWRQWRGDSIPRRYVVTNEFPRYRTLSGDPSASGLPHLSGYSFDAPVPVDPVLGQMLVECSEAAATDGASAHHWQSVVHSPAWLCSTPTNPAVVRLEYAPAQALYTETQTEPLTRLTDLVLSEREAYLDYLVHAIASPGWTWTNTQEAATNAAASFPAAATNEGHNAGANVAARWAASQARMDTLAGWVEDAIDEQIDAIAGLPGQTIDALTNDAAWVASEADAAPHAWLDMDHSFYLYAGYRTTWWSAAYDPTSMGCSNYIAPWIGYAEPRRYFGYAVGPWEEYGTNIYLTVTNLFFPTFDWSYLGTVDVSGPSSHSFEFGRSSCVITAAPPVLDGLDASAESTNHYGREAWSIGSSDWIHRAFSRKDNPVLPSFPACMIPCATNLTAVPTMNQYDELSELLSGGYENILAVNTNMVPPVTNWVPSSYLTLGWDPILTPFDYYITPARSNEAWRVTVNIASNDAVALPDGLPRPWIVEGFYVFEGLPVHLWTVTNDYAALYQRAPEDSIQDPYLPEGWDGATNSFYARAMEPASFWYQSCTNQPHGSTTEKGKDGAINCDHNATRTITLSAVPFYLAATNMVYFERNINGSTTNWFVSLGGTIPDSPAEVAGAQVETNVVFHLWDWPGEWVTWHRTGFGERTDYRTLWMGGLGGATGEPFKAEASAAWDYLPPLVYWQFYRLRNDD